MKHPAFLHGVLPRATPAPCAICGLARDTSTFGCQRRQQPRISMSDGNEHVDHSVILKMMTQFVNHAGTYKSLFDPPRTEVTQGKGSESMELSCLGHPLLAALVTISCYFGVSSLCQLSSSSAFFHHLVISIVAQTSTIDISGL